MDKANLTYLHVAMLTDKSMKSRELRVYAALARLCGPDWRCTTSRYQLSEMTGIAPSHISLCTARLAKGGYIERVRRGAGTTVNEYRLL